MERSKPLHNFILPDGLAWGTKRALRFGSPNPVRAMSNDDNNSSDSDQFTKHRSNRGEVIEDTIKTSSVKLDNSIREEHEISATREKIMTEYRTEIVKMQKSILKSNHPNEGNSEPVPPPMQSCGDGGSEINERKLLRPRRNVEKKEERPKFSITLTKKEIEEDFIAMTGKKPPRKPTKRPKGVQSELNGLFPGSYLSEINADRYKLNENGKI